MCASNIQLPYLIYTYFNMYIHILIYSYHDFKIKGTQELDWNNRERKWKCLTAAYQKTGRNVHFSMSYQPTVNFIATTSSGGKGDSLSGSRKGENNKIVSLVPGSCTSGTKRSFPDKMTTPSQRLKAARGRVQMRWCHGWMGTRRGNSI